MNVPLHIGFTGTRHGMSQEQGRAIGDIVDAAQRPVTAHHGCCVGADEDFHAICRERDIDVVGHPGPDWPDGPLCAYTICGVTLQPMPHMRRNAEIVNASHIMIAAPFENEPQLRGGTWATIRMALRALRRAKLRDLYVIGRGGERLEHGTWKP